MNSRSKYKRRIRILNFLAELIGSAIFSLLYFIFISRFLSSNFDLGIVILGLLIGASYFAAVYIPFHTYRIHIIPFISIIRALQKRKLEIFLYKIPAQIIGAFIGTSIYHLFSQFAGETVSVSDMWTYEVSSSFDLTLFNAITVFVLCYLFYIIQLLFKNMGFMSTFFYALVIQVVFIFTCQISEISAINIFGYFSIYLIEGNPGFSHTFIGSLVIHIIIPSFIAFLIYYYIRDRFFNHSNSTRQTT
jgi:hypothetical protein